MVVEFYYQFLKNTLSNYESAVENKSEELVFVFSEHPNTLSN